ncbi:hypothetical protein SeMB42_g03122 [Synchytrium endobioticum]|uniref:Ribosomal protein S16 n=1 Tax=Synchytrium endobioticum TaxID=286115 RepID=A0A507CS61_9FUNG|nr:hypothetical protein SeLEV6574_g05832 [Synchytrium endobioticum]TPX48126.1 hypothetical protein SeMB42_g03122 [Synchytrium endobioticum]
MSLRLRLARWGARRNPFYGIVVAHRTAARDKKPLEVLGTYCPVPDQNGLKHIELDSKRVKYWLACGGQPTERVAWLLAKAAIIPHHPHYLHNRGAYVLSDRKTWDVAVRDKGTGQILGTLSADEARAHFGTTVGSLPDWLSGDDAVKIVDNFKIPHELIKLDKTLKVKEELKADEKLFTLQRLLGIM